jgi:hypothetical protein
MSDSLTSNVTSDVGLHFDEKSQLFGCHSLLQYIQVQGSDIALFIYGLI